MPFYKYSGVNKKGETVKGTIDADDEKGARQALVAKGVRADSLKKDWTRFELGGGGMKTKELVIFTRQFATMINAGLSIIQALEILAAQSETPFFRSVLRKVKNSVEEGKSLSDALKEHKAVFTDLYVNLVAAGEVGGILDTILDRLAIFLEKNSAINDKIKSAMKYPAIVLIATIGITIVLLYWVVPTFAAMFMSNGQQLPGLTQMVVDMSEWMQANIIIVIILLVGIFFGFKTGMKNKQFRFNIHKLALQAPIVGDLIRKSAVARFTRTLGTLVSSGVPLVDGLEVVSRTAGNLVIEKAIVYVREKVIEGNDMTTPLTDAKIFPSMVVQMIGVGEATGAMDTMLNKIADFYEQEVDTAIDGLTSMIEPIMMIFIGGIVGTMMVAMYLPIFSMGKAVG
ncbi:MAG TPA: type II secretion system F family protein [bacterium]|nr:type II secretion system F family protein [bacterium]HPS28744.1 type II secretion system F family protein [bacterium]